MAYPLPIVGAAMNRKLFWLITVILLALIHRAEAQQPKKVPRIGYLSAFTPSAGGPLLEAFRQGLRELDYVEGQNIFIDYRWAEGRPDRFPILDPKHTYYSSGYGRPGRERLRRQPRSARWKYHRVFESGGGVGRKMA